MTSSPRNPNTSLIAGVSGLLLLALVAICHVWSFQNWLKTTTTTSDDNNNLFSDFKEEKKHQQCNMLYTKQQQQQCKIQPLVWEENCRPNYFIAGTRKGGTTSLHTYMAAHPNVFPFKIEGKPQDGEMYEKGITALRKYFINNLNIPKNQIAGEASVRRIIDDSWNGFAQNACNSSKIFVMLRDPIERCHSQMLMRHRYNTKGMSKRNVSDVIAEELKSFQAKIMANPTIVTELWDKEKPLYVSTLNCLFEGAYVVHLRRLLHKIPRERVRIYWSEDFLADPASVVRDALAFVGQDASEMDLETVVQQKFNAKPESQKRNETSNQQQLVLFPELRKQMEDAMDPFNKELEAFLGQTPPWMSMKKSRT